MDPTTTTASPAATEGTGQTPAGQPQAGTTGATSAATPAPPIQFTPEQQAAINQIVGQRVADTRAAEQQAAAEKALKEQGQFKTLSEQQEARIKQLEADLAAERRTALITRLAAAEALPPNLHKFITGADEAEITASVKELAAAVRPPAAPQTGAGAGTRPIPGGTTPGATPAPPKMEDFIPPGAVRW